MSGPPTDIPASTLFLKLLETPFPSEVIDFPRKDGNGDPIGKIRIRVLSQEDHDRGREAGHAEMKAKRLDGEDLKHEVIREVTADTVARHILAMACLTDTGPEDGNGQPMYGRVFASAADLKKLQSSEVAILFHGYMLVQAKYGPFEKSIGDDNELNSWIKRLEEGGSEFPLLVKPYPQLAELAYLLGRRAYSLSVILDSLWPTLPDTLKSALGRFSMGTGFYGEPVATSTQTTTESSDDAPLTTAMAARLAENMRGSE